MKTAHLLTALVIFAFVQITLAQIPQTISYQGVLTDENGNAVADDSYKLKFELHTTPNNGRVRWQETHEKVPVINGIFIIILGSVNLLDIPFDEPYFMAITVNDGERLEPLTPLTAVPYNLGLADSVVVGSKIALRQVVRSINGVADQVTLVGRGGAIITQDGNRIIITAGSGSGGSAWELSGNAGLDTSNFIGTLDTASFKIKVNNSLACQIINSPDPEFATPLPIILGGTKNHVVNAAQSGGSFIGGGGSKFSGLANQVEGAWSTIVAGRANRAGSLAFVGGGNGNNAPGHYGVIRAINNRV